MSWIKTKALFWHRRLAHLNHDDIKRLSKGAADGIVLKQYIPLQRCANCILGKMCKKPYKENKKRASALLDLVHKDLCEVKPKSNGNASYNTNFFGRL